METDFSEDSIVSQQQTLNFLCADFRTQARIRSRAEAVRFIGLCLSLAALLGCSTVPDLPAQQQLAHSEYVLSPQVTWRPELAATHARVRFARDSGLVSGACPFTVFVNNEPVVRLFAGQYFEAALPSGRHEIYVTFAGFFICPGDISNQVALQVKAGGAHTVRAGIRDLRIAIWSAE